MKKLIFLFSLVVLCSFTFADSSPKKIRWKKVTTEAEARGAMDRIILPDSDFDTDLKLLDQQNHGALGTYGDTVIYFHSKAVRHQFMISRKWMYTFHFEGKKMKSYTVAIGLTGP